MCGCRVKSCAEQGKNCGAVSTTAAARRSAAARATRPTAAAAAARPTSAAARPRPCAVQGKNCGTITDGCGGTLDCDMPGGCPSGQTCGGGGIPTSAASALHADDLRGAGQELRRHLRRLRRRRSTADAARRRRPAAAAARPTSAAARRRPARRSARTCGMASDGCGQMLDCGACTWPQSCGGGGNANVCGCTPTTLRGRRQELRQACPTAATASSAAAPCNGNKTCVDNVVRQGRQMHCRRPRARRDSAASSPTAATTS